MFQQPHNSSQHLDMKVCTQIAGLLQVSALSKSSDSYSTNKTEH